MHSPAVIMSIALALSGCAKSKPEDVVSITRDFVTKQRAQVERYCECRDESCQDSSLAEMRRLLKSYGERLAQQDLERQGDEKLPEDLATAMKDLSERVHECGIPRESLRVEQPAKLKAVAAARMAEYEAKQEQKLKDLEAELTAEAQSKCEAGDGRFCFSLAEKHADGEGVPVNIERSIELEHRSCDLGYALACAILAERYEEGNRVKEDLDTALGLYMKACDLGDPSTCDLLARAYAEGLGVEPDAKRAREFEDKARQAAVEAAKKAGVLDALSASPAGEAAEDAN